jgi:hypothetical protein
MRTERRFSSSGLPEVLPIYQLRLTILGVVGLAQGLAIAVHIPFYTVPYEYVTDVTYVNVVRTAGIVRMLFL